MHPLCLCTVSSFGSILMNDFRWFWFFVTVIANAIVEGQKVFESIAHDISYRSDRHRPTNTHAPKTTRKITTLKMLRSIEAVWWLCGFETVSSVRVLWMFFLYILFYFFFFCGTLFTVITLSLSFYVFVSVDSPQSLLFFAQIVFRMVLRMFANVITMKKREKKAWHRNLFLYFKFVCILLYIISLNCFCYSNLPHSNRATLFIRFAKLRLAVILLVLRRCFRSCTRRRMRWCKGNGPMLKPI